MPKPAQMITFSRPMFDYGQVEAAVADQARKAAEHIRSPRARLIGIGREKSRQVGDSTSTVLQLTSPLPACSGR